MLGFKPTYQDVAKQGSSISCHLMTNHEALRIQIIYATYTAFLYHTQLNVFFTFLDDALKRRKLGIKTKTISSSRPQLNHLPIPKSYHRTFSNVYTTLLFSSLFHLVHSEYAPFIYVTFDRGPETNSKVYSIFPSFIPT